MTILLRGTTWDSRTSSPGANASSIRGFLFGLAPSGVYLAANCYQSRGALLPHHFTLTSPFKKTGGIFSAALSVDSRPPGVTWHLTLWSPDFPLPYRNTTAVAQPALALE